MATNQHSTRQLLEKIPNFQCLYRHKLNETYYGIKKFAGKRKEHSLQTTDRKIAERKLADWIKSLDKLDTEQEKTTLEQLIQKFVAARQGKSDSTKATDASIVKKFKEQWKHGLDIRVSTVRPSQLGSTQFTHLHTKLAAYRRMPASKIVFSFMSKASLIFPLQYEINFLNMSRRLLTVRRLSKQSSQHFPHFIHSGLLAIPQLRELVFISPKGK